MKITFPPVYPFAPGSCAETNGITFNNINFILIQRENNSVRECFLKLTTECVWQLSFAGPELWLIKKGLSSFLFNRGFLRYNSDKITYKIISEKRLDMCNVINT